jgi:hypothetical protein
MRDEQQMNAPAFSRLISIPLLLAAAIQAVTADADSLASTKFFCLVCQVPIDQDSPFRTDGSDQEVCTLAWSEDSQILPDARELGSDDDHALIRREARFQRRYHPNVSGSRNTIQLLCSLSC